MFFATISLTYKSYFILVEGGGFEHILAELLRIFLWVGFFGWVITNSDYLVQTVIDSFFALADNANGGDSTPGIGGIFERGSVITGKILDQLSIFEPGQILGIILLAIFVGVIYALIAAHALFVLSELYVVTSAGVILLGFGGNQWTGSYAMNYFRYTFSVGMKVFSMFLVLGLGEKFLHEWVSTVDLGNFTVLITVLGILITLYYLVRLIPDMVQGMVNGSSVGNATPSIGAMASAGVAAMSTAASTAAGGSLAVAEAIKSAQGMEGGTFGNTLGNLAQSGAEVLGNRIMGDYNASSGGMMASMAQHMRQQRTGGSGLYGGTSSGNDHIGGSASGGSFGAGDPTTKEGTGPEEAQNASHDFGADDSSAGSEAGAGAWDTSEVGGKEHEFGAEDGGSWSWDASGVAAAGGAGDSDNPATRYRSPAVDLTRGGASSGGAESSTTKGMAGTDQGQGTAGSSGEQGFTANNDSGVAPSASVNIGNGTEGVTAKIDAGASGGSSAAVIGSMVAGDNMTSGGAVGSSIGAGSAPQSAALGADAQ
ncbi:MAG: P-type conjugative transfer protein TrbL, partial [Thiothrix lacustris]